MNEGGVDEAGVFHRIPRLGDSRPAAIFAREVLAFLVRKELLSLEWAERILSVRLTREARNRRWKPRYAMRKPEGYRIDAPGDLIHVDIVQIRFRDSETRYQYSSRDAISRWDCGRAFRRASSFTVTMFLEYMEKKFPLPARAI